MYFFGGAPQGSINTQSMKVWWRYNTSDMNNLEMCEKYRKTRLTYA